MNWTDENDLILAEAVLRHLREGSEAINAFEETGQKLNRTAASCAYRWNNAVRHNYINAIHFAHKQREELKKRNL